MGLRDKHFQVIKTFLIFSSLLLQKMTLEHCCVSLNIYRKKETYNGINEFMDDSENTNPKHLITRSFSIRKSSSSFSKKNHLYKGQHFSKAWEQISKIMIKTYHKTWHTIYDDNCKKILRKYIHTFLSSGNLVIFQYTVLSFSFLQRNKLYSIFLMWEHIVDWQEVEESNVSFE